VQAVTLTEVVPVSDVLGIAFARVDYNEGEPETYQLPLGFAHGAEAERIGADTVIATIARVHLPGKDEPALIYDAFADEAFDQWLFETVESRRKVKGRAGELTGRRTKAFRTQRGEEDGALKSAVLRGEQSNSSVVYGDRFVLKLFRKVEAGTNPDLEVGNYL